jgi:hypothetical protein
MRFLHLIRVLALVANQAFFARAASVKQPFVVQEQTTLEVGDSSCNEDDSPPTAHLDNATFSGIYIGWTAHFLGIPFAQPP